MSFSSAFTALQNEDDCTHTAEHFDQTTSAAAAARTEPVPHAQHDSGVSQRETRKPRPPQTELSGTTPGNTERAAGLQRNGIPL